MGKLQKQRAMRHNPMRVPDSHLPKGLSSASQSSSKKNEILPIIQKMSNPDPADRKWACGALSSLIHNDPSTRRLLQGRNVVGVLITRLTDNEEEVVVEAVGALRNLCIDGGHEICAEMYNKNILTPLITFIPKISSTLALFLTDQKPPENVRRVVYDFADSVITILWCLSETSNKALNAINDMHLVPFLIAFLEARDKLSLAPVTAAAQCLFVLTDDNIPAISDVRADAGYIACLLSITREASAAETDVDPRCFTLAVLAAGTLRNISPIPPPSSASAIDIDKDVVLPLLHRTITSLSLPDTTSAIQDLIRIQSSEPEEEKLSKNSLDSDHKSSIELQLDALEIKLRNVQLSLEILTGLCATLPDPEPDLIEDGDDQNPQKLDLDTDVAMDGQINESPSFLTALVAPVLSLVQPTSLSFQPLAAQSIHPPTTSALSAIHIVALECLNNIFLSFATVPNPTVTADLNSGLVVWNGIWSALGLVGTETGLGQEKRKEFWDVAVGVLWGVGRIWKGSFTSEGGNIDVLIQLCNATTDSKLQVKCIGTLECLAQNTTAIESNRVISEYLLSLLPSSENISRLDIEPLIQAVSALIDIFSDETCPYDVNFRQNGYLDRLVDSVEGIRKAIKSIDRLRDGGKELKRRGDELRENLVDFIKYRRSLG